MVAVTRAGAVGLLELNRPGKFNALRRKDFLELADGMDAFERPGSGVRAVLLHADGDHFCTGGDLAEAKSMLGDSAELDGFLRLVHATLARLSGSPLPVVAACQGMALAGGLELLLCCDVVFAADNARFGDQHVQYGLVPAWGATQRLPRVVGPNRALDLMYSGRRIDAPTALQWGLASYVVPVAELAAAALEYCETLAERSRPALTAMKSLCRASSEEPLETGLRLEREAVLRAMAGPDPAEGIAAFTERRPPRFIG
ncbi:MULTISPECIES: enoyl-CoA hydratase/isomerase family protein [unclassified Amycolatopsis]|uniref:enoyl-CoA hydratase/isomerase family protein n=1 Tax=unclassified Amycolatopsis TaxID=2618356 RepID=UPI001EE952C8|nr:enoyl-CoA hydratase/isomerase family protein [Amycolatopsis sp. Poz14]MCG3751924.1 enoyl-CoA hydratase/isomerase family protein [Amycolatopsis sp. Poz14]